jgi:hypothetical protein
VAFSFVTHQQIFRAVPFDLVSRPNLPDGAGCSNRKKNNIEDRLMFFLRLFERESLRAGKSCEIGVGRAYLCHVLTPALASTAGLGALRENSSRDDGIERTIGTIKNRRV